MDAPRDPFWTYEDLAVFVFLAIPAFLIAAMIGAGLKFTPIGTWGKAGPILVAQFAGYAIWFGGLYALIRSRYNAPFWASLGWHLQARWILPAVTSGMLLAVGIGVLGKLLKTPVTDTPMEELLKDPASRVVVAVLGTTMAPVFEELAFRGFLMPLLVRSFGAAAGIASAAIPFALLHGQQNRWLWQYIVLIAAAGVVFGIVKHRTRSTAAAALVHAGYNATFMLALFATEGLKR